MSKQDYADIDVFRFAQIVENQLADTPKTVPGAANGAWRVPGTDNLFVIGGASRHPDRGVVVVDFDGKVVHGAPYPAVREYAPLYIGIFTGRPDVKAAFHAHTPYLMAFSTAHRPLRNTHISLPRFGLRNEIPVTRYSARDDGSPLREVLRDHPDIPGVLHGNHGIFAFGDDIAEAATRVKFFEAAAQLEFIAEQLGGAKLLPPDAYDDIQRAIRNSGATSHFK